MSFPRDEIRQKISNKEQIINEIHELLLPIRKQTKEVNFGSASKLDKDSEVLTIENYNGCMVKIIVK